MEQSINESINQSINVPRKTCCRCTSVLLEGLFLRNKMRSGETCSSLSLFLYSEHNSDPYYQQKPTTYDCVPCVCVCELPSGGLYLYIEKKNTKHNNTTVVPPTVLPQQQGTRRKQWQHHTRIVVPRHERDIWGMRGCVRTNNS